MFVLYVSYFRNFNERNENALGLIKTVKCNYTDEDVHKNNLHALKADIFHYE